MSIECKICGKTFKNKIQHRHLKGDHNLTHAEYEKIYGRGSTDANYRPPVIPEDQKIECKECGELFKNVISNSHLKMHNMSTNDYKNKYGEYSLTTEYLRNQKAEFKGDKSHRFGIKHTDKSKQQMSEKLREGYDNGRIVPHNKGKNTSEDTKRKQSETKKRMFAEGLLTPYNKGVPMSDESKNLVSNGVKLYALLNPEMMSDRAKKAAITKKNNGYDPAFFRGMKHTDEAKRKISNRSSEIAKEKALKYKNKVVSIMEDMGYDEIYVPDTKEGVVTAKCPCGKYISCGRQLFNDSKIRPIGDNACRFCMPKTSSYGEVELSNWLFSLGLKIERNNKSIIWPHELDIVLPEYNLAIEFDGLYYHGEKTYGKDKRYHLEKTKNANEKGYDLIHVFEDEWAYKKEIVKSVILSKITPQKTLYARKCVVKEISTGEARNFLGEFHLSGYNKSKYKFGLFFNEELLSVMTFSKGNVSRKSYEWEIDRFASKMGYRIVGGASKLFKAFTRTVDPSTVISYADLRYGDGNVYSLLGFVREKDTVPNYWYFKPSNNYTRYHRYTLRKGTQSSDDSSLTEWENRKNQGWDRIWDCGNAKWTWGK